MPSQMIIGKVIGDTLEEPIFQKMTQIASLCRLTQFIKSIAMVQGAARKQRCFVYTSASVTERLATVVSAEGDDTVFAYVVNIMHPQSRRRIVEVEAIFAL